MQPALGPDHEPRRMTTPHGRLSRRRMLNWSAGGLATAGTFLLASSMSGSESVLPGVPSDLDELAVAEVADPGQIEFPDAPVALLPSDYAATRAYLDRVPRPPESVNAPAEAPAATAVPIEPESPGVSVVASPAPIRRGVPAAPAPPPPKPAPPLLPAVAPQRRAPTPVITVAAEQPTAAPIASRTPNPVPARSTPTASKPARPRDPYPWLPSTDRIVTPSVGIDARVITVGVAPSGVVDTPPHAAGRYVRSSQAGAIGNVVLSAHNDIDGGLFRALPDTPHDALIYIHRGPAVFTYAVRYQTKVWEEGAPERLRQKNARFLLPTANPVCTLITCVPLWVDTHRWIVRTLLIDSDVPPRRSRTTGVLGKR